MAALILFLLYVGGRLVWYGFRGSRTGDEVRCARCDYDLSGAVSEVCAECGQDITSHTTVRGHRRLHAGFVSVGSVLIVLGLLFASSLWDVVGWYHYYPVSWVVSDLEAGNARGYEELLRRVDNESIRGHQAALVIDRLLKLHSDLSLKRSRVAGIMTLVERLDAIEPMSRQQRECLLKQSVQVDSQMRSKIRQGEKVSALVFISFRGAERFGVYAYIVNCRYEVDGFQQPIVEESQIGGYLCNRWHGLGGKEEVDTTLLEPGLHDVRVLGELRIFETEPADPNRDTPVYSQNIHVTTSFQVFSRDEHDPLVRITDPRFEDDIRSNICFEVKKAGVACTVHGDLPVGLAYDVYISTIDADVFSGTMLYPPLALDAGVGMMGVHAIDILRVRGLILTPNPNVALQSLYNYEYYDRRLEFELECDGEMCHSVNCIPALP